MAGNTGDLTDSAAVIPVRRVLGIVIVKMIVMKIGGSGSHIGFCQIIAKETVR